MSRDLIIDRLFHHAATRPGDRALCMLEGGGAGGAAPRWTLITQGEYERRVRHLAAACVAAGLPPRGIVAIVGDNGPDWVIAALGAQVAGGVAAGIYQNASAEQIGYILRHSEASLVFVDSLGHWEKIRDQLETLPRLQRVVFMSGAAAPSHERCQSLSAFLSQGDGHESAAMARSAALRPEDLAVLLYTSGTTGVPKGAMLTHHNLAWTVSRCAEMIGEISPRDRIVSYLPLAHIAEQMFSVYLAAGVGYQVYFAGGVDRIREALPLARPTVFLGVPRVWEKLRTALQQRFREVHGVRARLLSWARGVALRAGRYRLEHGAPRGLLGVEERLARRVLAPIHKALGFDALRVAITGSAATSIEVIEFFLSLGLPLYEVYGQSEVTGPTTFNRPAPGQTRLGTAGLPVPGVEVKLAEDGEILVRGGNVFLGYYKDDEGTAAALVDGWLRSGDIGEIDRDGFLRITDRKKDLIKTSGGKYAAPQPLEKRLQDIDLVASAVVIGESRKYLTALVTLDAAAARDFARARGLPQDLALLAQDPLLRAHIQEGVDRLNHGLARFETIKRFAVLPGEFTVEGGELTPSQKVRRRVVAERYAAEIEALYPGE